MAHFPSFTVAAIQMTPVLADKEHNLAMSLAKIEEAAAAGAKLLVLPELCTTGYMYESREQAFDLAEVIPSGPTVQAWIDAARRHDVYIAGGMAEQEGVDLFNSVALVGPEGHIGTYRKNHLWGEEKLFFEPGNLGMPVFHTRIGRIGMVICYDGWFPELYRLAALQGADIICNCTNWVPQASTPANSLAMPNILAMAAAHCNRLNIICADRCGSERGQDFIGQSVIVGPNGWLLAGPASATEDTILYADVNIRRTRIGRQMGSFNNIVGDRREDVYSLTHVGQ